MSREREILKRKIECLETTGTITAFCHVNQLRRWLSIIDEQREQIADLIKANDLCLSGWKEDLDRLEAENERRGGE